MDNMITITLRKKMISLLSIRTLLMASLCSINPNCLMNRFCADKIFKEARDSKPEKRRKHKNAAVMKAII
jgi:hypothetical protein